MSNWEIEKEIKFIKRDKISTDIKKKKFINQMKNGLGDEIKESIKPKKNNWFTKIYKKLFK